MKKFNLILLALLLTLNAFNQQLPEKEVMELRLPKEAKKLSEKEYTDLQSQKFKHGMLANSANHLYERDGAIISYRDMSVPHSLKKSLEISQKMWTSIISKGGSEIVTSSKIITLNNIRFLLINYHDDNAYSIKFFSDYDSQLHFIAGNVNYEKGNDEKAQQFLMELLQSMHFAN